MNWKAKDVDVAQWIIYMQYGNQWEYTIYSKFETVASLPIHIKNEDGSTVILKNIAVTAIDRSGNESESFMVPVQ